MPSGECFKRLRVAVYGAGQLGSTVCNILATRPSYEVAGPYSRKERGKALSSGADVVVITTTSFLDAVAPDIQLALTSGSNVLTSAEECAYPWVVDSRLAADLHDLARARELTILGCGLNPGFAFDALVVTALGGVRDVRGISVVRIVDLSRFSTAILRRLGIGFTAEQFSRGTSEHTIHGHIGFPQSMRIVANKLALQIDRIEARIEPIFATRSVVTPNLTVASGESVGFHQHYTAIVGTRPWFECVFTGHIELDQAGLSPRDEIHIRGSTPLDLAIDPGLDPQLGSSATIANSVRRVFDAPPGWLTVAQLPPAVPT